ncbi:CaiB/BaiF CoA transferase family protein, partial [Streptomyces sp. NPDC056296]|uniref:CaiB/BaiF CoA transferase family protein n=1 Tax=Streptomyces sp. NPDC056296 TaxID=3345775 RepID=UPI0035DF7E07
MSGPLTGVRVVELGGIGPGPHAAMILADLGADVVRVLRPAASNGGLDMAWEPRGCRKTELDLKLADDRRQLLDLVAVADVLVEGFRPGVAERLGVGPDTCLALNPGLAYGRITGWGQDGPWARAVGHDINYLSVSGILHAIGPADERPVPPLSLVGDFGGGSMLLVVGILAALMERNRSGRGQVVDAAMLDGAMLLGDLFLAQRSAGLWTDRRGDNVMDGGAPFYRTYTCADGRFVAVGAIEPQFFAELVTVLGLELPDGFDHLDRANWPTLADRLAAAFRAQDRDHWEKAFAGRDACVTPVLSFDEMPAHPHIEARRLVEEHDGTLHAAPAPRFSRTATQTRAGAREKTGSTGTVWLLRVLGEPPTPPLQADSQETRWDHTEE